MPYEFYKVAHIALLLIFVSSFAATFLGGHYNKKLSMLAMVSSLLMLVAGFGLLARLQIWTWPMWVMIKTGVWLILSASAPILAKRVQSNRGAIFAFWMALALIAVVAAVYKPL